MPGGPGGRCSRDGQEIRAHGSYGFFDAFALRAMYPRRNYVAAGSAVLLSSSALLFLVFMLSRSVDPGAVLFGTLGLVGLELARRLFVRAWRYPRR